MRGTRIILAVSFTTALLFGGHVVSTQVQPTKTHSATEYDTLTTGELYQQLFGESVMDAGRSPTAPRLKSDPFASMIVTQPVAQRVLASSSSSRSKPRRTRPAPRRSARPKSISQRTRMVGKEAHARSTTRLQNNKARAKQRIKRIPVIARRQANIARKRTPVVKQPKTGQTSTRKTSTRRSSTSTKRKKPKARNK